jgi:hypothetical protein
MYEPPPAPPPKNLFFTRLIASLMIVFGVASTTLTPVSAAIGDIFRPV